MFRDIENRYYQIKLALKQLLDAYLVGRERSGNSLYGYILARDGSRPDTLYQVNAGTFIYDMSPQQLSDLLLRIETILDNYLLEGGSNNLWALQYVSDEYQRGTLQAFTNLSAQSVIYEQSTTLQQLLSSPAYQNQVAAAYISTYSEWRGITDAARADLSNIVADAIGRGVNPRETASLISKRLDVSMSRAKTIAQTEQVGALRQAQWSEAEWSKERLGLNTVLLWISALKSTTRAWHAARHGKAFTTEEVEAFYAQNGNRYNCYCSQIPVLLNEDGSIFNEWLADKLTEERKAWSGER
ncbi:phage head morphogenesis protein [Cronobacter sakazakii]|uniref:phage head morphogenesis protein n=1 Tax=Cronobacter sakazakii TaxID=28141 RepID=UPI0021AB97D0|nr:phage head morphogenesis protein [Cronobacter sakazakii]